MQHISLFLSKFEDIADQKENIFFNIKKIFKTELGIDLEDGSISIHKDYVRINLSPAEKSAALEQKEALEGKLNQILNGTQARFI